MSKNRSFIHTTMALLSNKVTEIINEQSKNLIEEFGTDYASIPDSKLKVLEHRFYAGLTHYLLKNKHMFFRDFSGNTALIDSVQMYIEDLFLTRTEVANNRSNSKDNTAQNKENEHLTKAHELMQGYFQESMDSNWHGSAIIRYKEIADCLKDDFFKKPAKKLQDQVNLLGKKYSANAKSRRDSHGGFVLTAKSNSTQVAEELMLHDVRSVIPLPIKLQPQIALVGKPSASAYIAELWKAIFQNKNERYGLMYALGLSPEFDLPNNKYDSDNKRTELSISNLKQLKMLVKAFKKQKSKVFQNEQRWDEAAQFNHLFNVLKEADNFEKINCKKFTGAGFKNAEDCYQFYQLHISPNMIHLLIDDEEYEDYSPGVIYPAEIPSLSTIDVEADDQLFDKPKQHPEWFNPITEHVFKKIIAENATLAGRDVDKLLKDEELRWLINLHPELGYDKLNKSKLLARLIKEILDIIDKLP